MGAQRDQAGGLQGSDFQGLVTSIDPHDLPPLVAANIKNVQVNRQGMAQIRPGYVKVAFEDIC